MRRSLAVVAAAALALESSACVSLAPSGSAPVKVAAKQPGPPPHAPAHGYRRKHPQDDVALVFDSGLGVYVVVDTPDCWWTDAGFYRWREGVWYQGPHVSGPWKQVVLDSVPPGLRAYAGQSPGTGNGRGRGNGNGPPASRQR